MSARLNPPDVVAVVDVPRVRADHHQRAEQLGRLLSGQHADHRAHRVADEDDVGEAELAADLDHVGGVAAQRAVLLAVVGGQVGVARTPRGRRGRPGGRPRNPGPRSATSPGRSRSRGRRPSAVPTGRRPTVTQFRSRTLPTAETLGPDARPVTGVGRTAQTPRRRDRASVPCRSRPVPYPAASAAADPRRARRPARPPNEVCTMTAAAVRSTTVIPAPRTAADDRLGPASRAPPSPPRRRLPAGAAPAGPPRAAAARPTSPPGRRPTRPSASPTLTRHADLIGRVLLHHHAVERESVWPALLRAVPGAAAATRPARSTTGPRAAPASTTCCATSPPPPASGRVALTAPRATRSRWPASTSPTPSTRRPPTRSASLLPLLGEHLRRRGLGRRSRRSVALRPAGSEQLLVLGLALEDASAGDRARLLEGVPRSARWAWRLGGERRYRAAVVRLRGEPPAREPTPGRSVAGRPALRAALARRPGLAAAVLADPHGPLLRLRAHDSPFGTQRFRR